jgi:hypothetical protein
LPLLRAGKWQVYDGCKDLDDPGGGTAHTWIIAFVRNLFCQRIHASKATALFGSHKPIIMFDHLLRHSRIAGRVTVPMKLKSMSD